MAVIELVGNFATIFSKEVFVKHLEPIFMTYLTNTAASVREMGILKIKDIAEKFKADWIISSFIPKLIENYNVDKQGYNYRMCSLNSCLSIIPFLSKE